MLADKDVVLGSIWNGRLQAIADKGAPVAIEWNQHMLQVQGYGIFKDAPEPEGRRSSSSITRCSPRRNSACGKELNYGPINTKTFALLTAAEIANLPGSPENNASAAFCRTSLVGREPRQGQLDMVEMDPVVAERGRAAAMVAEMAPQGRSRAARRAECQRRAAARSSCVD